jgi:VCBS repeat protein
VNSAYLFVARAALLLLAILTPRVAFAQAGAIDAPPRALVLRAGTAAAPFSTSTAIADFDADGAPDIAVANRIGRASSHYNIEVRLSAGSTPQTVSFVSTRGALNITAFDVDNDHDADLVITPVLGRDVVDVWVNDGAGHFEAGNRTSYTSLGPMLGAGPSLTGVRELLISLFPGRRLDIVAAPSRPRPRDPTNQARSECRARVVVASAFASGTLPRPPPSSHS